MTSPTDRTPWGTRATAHTLRINNEKHACHTSDIYRYRTLGVSAQTVARIFDIAEGKVRSSLVLLQHHAGTRYRGQIAFCVPQKQVQITEHLPGFQGLGIIKEASGTAGAKSSRMTYAAWQPRLLLLPELRPPLPTRPRRKRRARCF